MCGIAGFLSPGRSADETIARAMADRIVHRGPDLGATWSDAEAGLALAHRRLSILELSEAGNQPMLSADGRYVLIFNGEIYNHHALRADLEAAGQRVAWRGQSDTEALLESLAFWGVEEGIKRANGMFALALWDRRDGALWLIRDRLGEKPLYYGTSRGSLMFGSELKALAAHPDWEGSLDRNAVALFLRFGYVPEPYSIFDGICKLAPGHMLRITADDLTNLPASQPYWSLDAHVSGDRSSVSEADLVDMLEQRLKTSVRSRMEADVGLGAFLSGGIDSSLIVALMQSQTTRPVDTFTIGFDVPGFNEAVMAKEVAEHLGTRHNELYVTPRDTLDVVPDLPHVWDEPFADSSQIPTLILSKLTRQSVTVALSGDGGDEFFGGYNRYGQGYATYRKLSALPGPVRSVAAALMRHVPAHAIDRMIARLPGAKAFPAVGDRIQKLGRVLDAPDVAAFYAILVSQHHGNKPLVLGAQPPQVLADNHAAWPKLDDPREVMMYVDAKTYLPGDIMSKVDRATMAYSLESRAPFLDHDIVEFAWSLPMSVKIKNGKTKWALREVLSRYLPRSLFERPKMGFGIPIEYWLSGPLRDWAGDLLADDRIRRQGLLDPEQVAHMWHQQCTGHGRWHHQLWTILMLQAWLDTGIAASGRSRLSGRPGSGAH